VVEEGSRGGGNRSVLTALRVMEEVAARQPVGVSDLARALDLPKTTVQRAIRSLAEAGWLRMTGSEVTRWRISHRALSVGLAGIRGSGLDEIAHDEMRKVRDQTSETVHLAVRDGDDVVIVSRLDGTRSVRTYRELGKRAPLYASSSGRAILASTADESDVERVLSRGIRRWTDRSLPDVAAIRGELQRTRERGYALNAGEWREGIGGIGVAILDRRGWPQAALSISMPLARYEQADLPGLAELLTEAAQRIGHLGEV
jgi:IclR family acetate operon transcriptional repressor